MSQNRQQGKGAWITGRLEALAHSKHMLWGIGTIAFFESMVPITLEVFLIALMLAHRQRAWTIASTALTGYLAGACTGYAIGYFVFDAVGDQLINWLSTPEQYQQVRQSMQERGFWFVLSVGVSPIPTQIATLTAGALAYSFWLFVAAIALARGARFYGLAFLVDRFGEQALRLFERHKLLVTLLLCAVILSVWIWAIWG